MKLTLPNTTLETSAQFVDQSFAIGDMAVIMEILRGKMYSNPIKTIVQEIGSNARDAHREVGKRDIPIKVKLPNRLSPTFEVRDFGPGISPDRMANIFLRYGCSTKREDNVQTGGFGLGAKSPFAYSDTFGVESIVRESHFGGMENCLVKRTYIALIDPTRIGKMSLVSEEATTEDQGTKITVTCKPGDESKFAEWVKVVYQYWPKAGDPRPEVTGYAGFEWAKEKANLFEGKDWTLNISAEAYQAQVIAVVDGIPFTIRQNSIGGLSDHTGMLFSKNVVIYFKTGDLALTANREELDYQPKTIATVKTMLKTIRDSLKDAFEVKLSNCKSYWDASVMWNALRHEFRDIIKSVKWQKIDVEGESFNVDSRFANVWKFEKDITSGSIKGKKMENVHYDKKYVVAFDDTGLKHPSRGRIAALLKDTQNDGKDILTITWKDELELSDDCIGTKASLRQQFKEFKEQHHVHLWGAINLSTITPLKMPKVKGASGRVMVKVRKYTDYHGSSYSQLWKESEETLEEGEGLYVILRDKEAYIQVPKGDGTVEKVLSKYDLKTLLNLYADDTEIYGIQARYANRIGENWTGLGESAVTKFRRKVANTKYIDEGQSEYAIHNNVGTEIRSLIGKEGKGILLEWLTQSEEMTDCERNSFSLRNIAAVLGLMKELEVSTDNKIDLKATMDKVLKDFPLIHYIATNTQGSSNYNDHSRTDDWKKMVRDYLNK